jgi:hypothetical protein
MTDAQRPPSDPAGDRRTDAAIRSVLGDFTSASPRAGAMPTAGDTTARPVGRPSAWRRPLTAVAAGLVVIIGGVGLVASRDRDPSGSAPTSVAGPAPSHATDDPTSSIPDVAPYLPDPLATTGELSPVTPPPGSESPCAGSEIPDDAHVAQTIEGDIDGDGVDDTVSLYYFGDEMFVYATSSVKGWSSTTPVTLLHADRMMETISFEDVDYSLGADLPPPRAVMVTGVGDRIDGAWANFTFLTNTAQYCIRQWTYRRPSDDVVEPFQWVALREPGHLTGMICEGAAGSRYYALVDSERNDDGSWTVFTRLLTHDFTRAIIEFQPERSVPDSPDMADRYGDIVGCDHPPIGGG